MTSAGLEASSAGATRTYQDLPGPRGLPLLGNARELKTPAAHLVLERWCREHGKLFRFSLGPKNFVGVGDTQLAREVMQARPDRFGRIGRIEPMFREMEVEGLFSAEGAVWRRQRKLIGPAFKQSYLEGFAPSISLTTRRLLHRWRAAADRGEPSDVLDDFACYTVDVTTLVAFGHDLNSLETGGGELQTDIKLVFEMLSRRINSAFPYWRYFKLKPDRELDRALSRVKSVMGDVIATARERVARKRERGEDPATLLEAILLAELEDADGETLHSSEVVGNMLTLLLAGEDTTSNTLAWMVHYLATQPELSRRLRAEVEERLGAAELLEKPGPDAAFPFLQAVAFETLRLRSTAPVLYLEANQDVALGGYQVVQGTALAILTRYLGLQEENFSEPERFDPERWMAGCPVRGNHQAKNMLAFGLGPRICPGRALALIEIQMVMAMLCQNFELELVGDADVTERFAFTMRPSSVKVRLKRRR